MSLLEGRRTTGTLSCRVLLQLPFLERISSNKNEYWIAENADCGIIKLGTLNSPGIGELPSLGRKL